MKAQDILNFLSEDLFIPNIKAKDKNEALRLLVDHLVGTKRIKNGKILLTTLLEREKLGSTGLEKGIAVPHSRSMMVDRLTLLFARAPEGIDFDAIDGKPVQLIFLILAPPVDKGNLYLPLLGKIIEVVVKDEKTRKKVMEIETYDELEKIFKGKK
ncbi:MAG: PTS sugar transporter subunit IIA [Acidobacteriota bacterium]